jgi:dienelactone hydrolase
MTRRLLRLAALLLPLLLPVSPPRAAEAVLLPGPGGVTLRGLLVLPGDGRPGMPVVALHGCAGLGGPAAEPRLPPRERDWAARLAARGHPVLFPDSFGSRGVAETCRGGERGLRPETLRREDALAAAAWAAAQPWAVPGAGVFLLGWSHGASTALAAAAAPVPPGLIRAAVALYPGCRRAGQALPEWRPAVPVLMLLGEADEWTPSASCRDLAARAGAGVTVIVYPGAHHGFDQPGMPLRELRGLAQAPGGVARMGTDPAARQDALQRLPAFLARHGAPAHKE